MWSGINQVRGGSGAGEAWQHVLRSKSTGSTRSQLLPRGVSTGKQTNLVPQGKGLPPPQVLIRHGVLALPPNTPSLFSPSKSLWERKSLCWHRCKRCPMAKILHPPSHPRVRVGTASVTIPAEFPSNEGSKIGTCSQSCLLPTSPLQNPHKERCKDLCKPSRALLWGCSGMGSRPGPPCQGAADIAACSGPAL